MTTVAKSWAHEAETTILLVDDDPFQANTYSSVLRRSFPTVERASEAAEAFILMEHSAFLERLGLVIVDLHLPGIAGPDFVSELTARHPEVPVLALLRKDEDARDFHGESVHFLPRSAPTEQMLRTATRIMRRYFPRVA